MALHRRAIKMFALLQRQIIVGMSKEVVHAEFASVPKEPLSPGSNSKSCTPISSSFQCLEYMTPFLPVFSVQAVQTKVQPSLGRNRPQVAGMEPCVY